MEDWAHRHVVLKLAERYGREADEITIDMPLSALVGDSLDAVELLMEFEDELGDPAEPEEDAPFNTVGDLID